MNSNRKLILRWAGWFSFTNAILLWLIGIPYLSMLFPIDPNIDTLVRYTLVIPFIFISYTSHFALVSILILGLSAFILSIFLSRIPLLIRFITASIATLLVFLTFADTFVFTHFRFHLNAPILQMVSSGKASLIFGFSSVEWLIILGAFAFFLLIEMVLSILIWRYVILGNRWYRKGKYLTFSLFGCLIFSYSMYISSLDKGTNLFTQQTKVLPYYEHMLTTLLPFKGVKHAIENHANTRFSQLRQVRSNLYYPQNKLQCAAPDKKNYNILMVVIDSWRYDAVTKELTPNIEKFAKENWQFTQHMSGGNSTQAGLVSLMYGIPSTYWTSILEQEKSPVFTQVLKQQGYKLGAFTSSEMETPPLDKTILRDMDILEDDLSGKTPLERDQQITEEALDFMREQQEAHTPSFTFLFYDSAHSYCMKQNFPKKFQPAVDHCNRMALYASNDPTQYYNRYKNAVHFVDTEIKKLLAGLKEANLLKNTIVIITGDHGQEFNDTKLRYWEHAGNYTRFQVQTPLIVHWPKQTAETFSYTTTHYDVVPTLLQKVFACKNPSTDYTIGHNLLDNKTSRFPVIAGSYINFAMIEPEQATLVYPSGTIEVQNSMAKPMPNASPNEQYFQEVLLLLRKFYTPVTKK